jgi:hypothetical protein
MRIAVAAFALCLAAAWAEPAAAQPAEPPPQDGTAQPAPGQEEAEQGEIGQGLDLLGEGARLMLRGLLQQMEPALRGLGQDVAALRPVLEDLVRMIGDVRNYHAPEMLPNGDIIIRRKVPLPVPGEDVEI